MEPRRFRRGDETKLAGTLRALQTLQWSRAVSDAETARGISGEMTETERHVSRARSPLPIGTAKMFDFR